MTYSLIRLRENEPMFTRALAAQLARVSLEFLSLCEQADLIEVQVMSGGGVGYSTVDIRRLARIRRLCRDLDLDLTAVEVVLHLRRQVLDLLAQLEEMEQQQARREQELLNEIQQLRRRLAEEADWL